MLLVIDTNIIINTLLSHSDDSKSMQLLDDIFNKTHRICVSSEIMDEYREVMSRPKFRIPKETIEELMQWIDENSIHIEPRPSDQNTVKMRHEDDRKFFDVAKCMGAKLVTRNYKHYPVHELVTLIDELY